MGNILVKFQNILNSKILQNSNQNEKGEVYLIIKETDLGAKLKEIKITQIEGEILCFKHQSTSNINNNFLDITSSLGFIKSCDAVILLSKDDKITPIYCELKSSPPKPDCQKQLIYSEAFTNYLKELVDINYGMKVKLEKSLFFVFYLECDNSRTLNQKTTPRVSKNNNIETIEMSNFKGKFLTKIKVDSHKSEIKFNTLCKRLN
jgi:hypothetical protein